LYIGKGKDTALIQNRKPHTAAASVLCVTDRASTRPRPRSKLTAVHYLPFNGIHHCKQTHDYYSFTNTTGTKG